MPGFPVLHHLLELTHIRGMTQPRQHTSAQSPPQGPQYPGQDPKSVSAIPGAGTSFSKLFSRYRVYNSL